MDTDLDANLEQRYADPNEITIKLLASAIRQSWSPAEERRRRGELCDWTPPDASEAIFSRTAGSLRLRSS